MLVELKGTKNNDVSVSSLSISNLANFNEHKYLNPNPSFRNNIHGRLVNTEESKLTKISGEERSRSPQLFVPQSFEDIKNQSAHNICEEKHIGLSEMNHSYRGYGQPGDHSISLPSYSDEKKFISSRITPS